MIKVYATDHDTNVKEYISDEMYARQKSSRHFCVPVHHNAYFLAFYWCDIRNTQNIDERVSIFCGEKDILFLTKSLTCQALANSLCREEPTFHILYKFLSELTAQDIDILQRLEFDINEFEDGIITAKKPIKKASTRIILFRRSLLKMKRYYEQLSYVIDILTDNENGAIPETLLKQLLSLGRRIDRLTESIEHLREYVTQVREAYQSQIDIEQNQIMKIFTVLTAIFLPLTLIVGWYGMNFNIPEYGWRFGYLYVTVLSITVCIILFFLFKKKKWF
ncbi:CorA family divalent cation transporter [Scatolibacter rhodanostii]|uniref:CorA family divalent cation transporter n=1 Tax=Scatolibacter rhodanostii TaxID=2014781 RepID=UPI000C07C24E|nr:CorA family divalent cation transporter [Scatolibacter rhodanostii]